MASQVQVDINARVEGFVQGMKQATDGAQKYESQTKKVQDSTMNFRKELAKAKKDAANLAASYRMLDKEAKQSQFGREMKRQLDEAKVAAAKYMDMQADLQTELRNMASDTKAFNLVAEGIGTMSSAMSAAIGVMATITGSQEDARKAMVAFATAQSVVTALTQIQTMVQRQSNTMMAVGKVQSLAAAGAIKIKAAAEGKSVAVTKLATVAQAAFNKVAYANPYVLLAASIIGVVSALALFVAHSNKSAAAQEIQNKKTERAKAINEAYQSSLQSSIVETTAKYRTLQTQWASLQTTAQKTQWLKENADKFHELGFEVNNVVDAENFFIKNEAQVIASLNARAKAAAYAQKAIEVYKQALDSAPKKGEKYTASQLVDWGIDLSKAKKVQQNWVRDDLYELDDNQIQKVVDDAWDAAEKENKKNFEKQLKYEKQSSEKLAKAGVKAYNKTKEQLSKTSSTTKVKQEEILDPESLAYAEKQLKDLQDKLQKVNVNRPDIVKELIAAIDEAQRKVKDKKIKLGLELEAPKGSTDALNAEISALQAKVNKLVIGTEAYDQAQQQLQKLIDYKNLLTEGIKVEGQDLSKAVNGSFEKSISGYEKTIAQLEQFIKGMDLTNPEMEEKWNQYIELVKQYKSELKNIQDVYDDAMLTPQEKIEKHNEKVASSINNIGNMIDSTGDAFSALGELTKSEEFNVIGIISKAIATVAMSYAQALTTCKTWVEWMAFGASGLATMLSMITSIKQATHAYAQGGVVGGNSYWGDNLYARVNSGEMILNNRQQRRLFDLLDTGAMPNAGGQTIIVKGKIRGTDILLTQENLKKLGKRSGLSVNF